MFVKFKIEHWNCPQKFILLANYICLSCLHIKTVIILLKNESLKIVILPNYLLVIKTLEIKAWWDRRPKIDLNFCAVGLQEAVAGAFEPVNECYCISGIFLEKNVSGQHNYYKQLNINLHLKFSLDQFSSCSKNISSSIFCFSVLSFLVIPRHSHKPMSWRFFIHKKVKTFTFLK